jgi:hypothetical protein
MEYRVSFPESIRLRLKALAEKLRPSGQGKELGRVLAGIIEDLRYRPLEVGEIMYHLRHIPMPVKTMTKEYMAVVFAVHEAKKFVMVKKLTMLADHPFPDGTDRFLNQY